MEEDKSQEKLIQTSLTVYKVFIYALLYTIIFVYLQEDISYNIILFILIVVHVLFGVETYNFVNTVKPDENQFKFLLNFIPLIVAGSLIVRTISLSLYTFGYTSANIKSYNLGEKYDPPKKYKVPEENYKFSYYVSTLCLFIIYVMYLFAGESLKINSFNLTDIESNDIFSILSILTLGVIMLFDMDFKSYYQQAIYTFLTIVGLMILFLLTLLLHPTINEYLIPITMTSVGGIIGYIIDLSINKKSVIENEGRIFGSLSGYLFSLIIPYIPFFNSIYDMNRTENNTSKLIQNIIGFTGVTMVTTSVFEMIDAIEYEKYHSKIYKYKKEEETEDTVLEESQHDLVQTLINIVMFIVCAILIFIIFLYSFGMSGQNLLFAGIFSLLLTTYFSSNSFISSIIGTQFKY